MSAKTPLGIHYVIENVLAHLFAAKRGDNNINLL
jgi:hypothetical protein